MSTGCLYRRVDEHTYIRFDPAANTYTVVPSHHLPPLAPVARRVRLSASVLRADPGARLRQACALAMIDLAEEAQSTGDPHAFIGELVTLARLPEQPEEARRIGLSSIIPPARALPPEQAEAQTLGSDVRLQDVLDHGAVPSAANLIELMRIVRMTPAELRRLRARLEASWNGAGLRRGGVLAKLTTWAKRPTPTEPPPVRLSHTAGTPAPRRERTPGTYTRL